MTDGILNNRFISVLKESPNLIKPCTCQCAEHLKLSMENLIKTRDTLNKCLFGIRQLELNVKEIPKLRAVIRVQNKLINELTALSDNQVLGRVIPYSIDDPANILKVFYGSNTKKPHRRKINVINEVLRPYQITGSSLSANLNKRENTKKLGLLKKDNDLNDKACKSFYNHASGDYALTPCFQNSSYIPSKFHQTRIQDNVIVKPKLIQTPLIYVRSVPIVGSFNCDKNLKLEDKLSNIDHQKNEIHKSYRRRRVHHISRLSLRVNSNTLKQVHEETNLRHTMDFSCKLLQDKPNECRNVLMSQYLAKSNNPDNNFDSKAMENASNLFLDEYINKRDTSGHDYIFSIPEAEIFSTRHHAHETIELALPLVTESVIELKTDVYSFANLSKVNYQVEYCHAHKSLCPIVYSPTQCSLQQLSKLCVNTDLPIRRPSSSLFLKIGKKSIAETENEKINSGESSIKAMRIRSLYKKFVNECEITEEINKPSLPEKPISPIDYMKDSASIFQKEYINQPPHLEEINDLSNISESDPISVSDVVSLFADDVLVEISNEFKRHVFDQFFDEHLKNSNDVKIFRTMSPTKSKREKLISKITFSQSLEMIILGAYSDVIPDGFVNSCYFLQQWLEDSTLITSADLNSAIATIRDCWFSIAEDLELMDTALENYLEVLAYFTTPTAARVVNQFDKQGSTLLHLLIKKKHWKTIDTLLSKCNCCDANIRDVNGFTPLMLASTTISQPMGVDEHISIDVLIKFSNVNLISSNNQRTTALILAAINRKSELITRLINKAKFLDVNLPDAAGDTALMLAVRMNHWEIVRLLVTHTDVDLGHQNKVGDTALTIAKLNENCDIAMLLFVKHNMQRNNPSRQLSKHHK